MTYRHQVSGVDFEWDLDSGVHRFAGSRSLAIWIETSMAGLMSGLQRMVGTERFNLSLQGGGRDSVENDWQVVASGKTFEEGFETLSMVAALAGWGRWTLVSVDRQRCELVFRVTDSWEVVYQRALGVTWGSSYNAGKFAGLGTRLFGVKCFAEQTAYSVAGDAYDEFLVRPSDADEEDEFEGLLRADAATRADLAVALEKLRREIQERKETEQDLRSKLDVIRRQEDAIRALSTPILQVWDGVLALPLIGVIDSQRAAATMERLLVEIVSTRSRYVILDLTGVDVVDTSTAEHLVRIVRAIELLGTRSVITGIGPAVAQTMTSLDVDLSRIATLGNLRDGLKQCIDWIDREARGDSRGRPRRHE